MGWKRVCGLAKLNQCVWIDAAIQFSDLEIWISPNYITQQLQFLPQMDNIYIFLVFLQNRMLRIYFLQGVYFVVFFLTSDPLPAQGRIILPSGTAVQWQTAQLRRQRSAHPGMRLKAWVSFCWQAEKRKRCNSWHLPLFLKKGVLRFTRPLFWAPWEI